MDPLDIEVIVLTKEPDDGALVDNQYTQNVKGTDFDHAQVESWGLKITYGDETWGIPWHRVHAFR